MRYRFLFLIIAILGLGSQFLYWQKIDAKEVKVTAHVLEQLTVVRTKEDVIIKTNSNYGIWTLTDNNHLIFVVKL